MGLFLPFGGCRADGGGVAVTDAAKHSPLRAYSAVTAAYWAFMLSDGALRMLVLLHFNSLGFTPVQLAWLFLLYEAAGIVTNLGAGWLAARFGLAATLYGGLALQIGALVALAQTTVLHIAAAVAVEQVLLDLRAIRLLKLAATAAMVLPYLLQDHQ